MVTTTFEGIEEQLPEETLTLYVPDSEVEVATKLGF
jgi:hypothetical protein